MVTILGTLLVYVLWRNYRVWSLRCRMIDAISEANTQDIQAGRDVRWRWQVFDSVSYGTMLWQAWKPVRPSSFWKNEEFLRGFK